MKKNVAVRLELCQMISDGLVDKDDVLLELLSRTTPSKVRELIEMFTIPDEEELQELVEDN